MGMTVPQKLQITEQNSKLSQRLNKMMVETVSETLDCNFILTLLIAREDAICFPNVSTTRK
jgi:hypothetical protein